MTYIHLPLLEVKWVLFKLVVNYVKVLPYPCPTDILLEKYWLCPPYNRLRPIECVPT